MDPGERRTKMKEFQIEVIETLSKVVTVEADTIEDAVRKVNEQYDNSEIQLDYDDYKGYDIQPYEDK